MQKHDPVQERWLIGSRFQSQLLHHIISFCVLDQDHPSLGFVLFTFCYAIRRCSGNLLGERDQRLYSQRRSHWLISMCLDSIQGHKKEFIRRNKPTFLPLHNPHTEEQARRPAALIGSACNMSMVGWSLGWITSTYPPVSGAAGYGLGVWLILESCAHLWVWHFKRM